MDADARKEHWEEVYHTKAADTVSWFQPVPLTSLELITGVCPDKKAAIIDIGCGDAFLSEALLQRGYENLSALDISHEAIERARKRIGAGADEITWLAGDVLDFKPHATFDFWHDRAAFHFLTMPEDISAYADIAGKGIKPGGWLLVAAFSETGPDKCSGLPVHQYNEKSLSLVFRHDFELVKTMAEKHRTPAGKEQDFIFCLFKRK